MRQLFEAPLASAGADERAALLRGAAALAGPLFEAAPAGRPQPRHDSPATISLATISPATISPATISPATISPATISLGRSAPPARTKKPRRA